MRGARGEIGSTQDDGEFLAAEAADDRVVARRLPADRAQHLIADLVSVGIVHPFEVVDIEHDRDRPRRGRRRFARAAALLEKGAAVEDARQRVDPWPGG